MSIALRTLLLLALALPSVACHEPPAGPPAPITGLPRDLHAGELRLVSGSNEFAFELVRRVNEHWADSNVFISPLSASMALGMTMNGARAETYDAMRAALGLSASSPEEINASYRSLIELLRGLDRRVEFRLANGIWYHEDIPFHRAFFASSREHFDADVRPGAFDQRTIDEMNRWVSGATNGRIETIVENIPLNVAMYLVNAIYFKGSWRYAFDRGETAPGPFHLADGSTVTVPLMRQQEDLHHYRGAGFEAVDLPYGGGAFSMTVLLPGAGSSIDDLLAALSPAAWAAMEDGFATREVGLVLPKLRLAWEDTLNTPLKAMGMEVAFDDQRANFDGMSPRDDLYISLVKQKTFVDIHEEGTEAAAVTSVAIGLTSVPDIVPFTVDRPYAFAIRERFSGTILFLGKIMDPSRAGD